MQNNKPTSTSKTWENKMKIRKTLSITILTLLGLILPITGKSQVYTLSMPIGGSLTMSAADYNGGYPRACPQNVSF
jgi:hypothetical protein